MNTVRERLPETRFGKNHKVVLHSTVEICPHCKKNMGDARVKVFLTVNNFPDGRPGEVFVCCDQAGSTLDGLADMLGILLSLCLQYGVPLSVLVEKMRGQKFEPQGFTGNDEIPFATSLVDYLAQWLEREYPEKV